ncbi:MAG TPA: hypothetical protein VMN57_05635 [Anaerolineales bacterium]|nr:hypothetical protein [Anaerolineales bacterium]
MTFSLFGSRQASAERTRDEPIGCGLSASAPLGAPATEGPDIGSFWLEHDLPQRER